jgi:hypothetical protein
MNTQEQLSHYEAKLSALLKEFRNFGKHPDMYCSWSSAISILKTQKGRIENFGDEAFLISRKDIFRLDEIIQTAQKALETVKARAALKTNLEAISAHAEKIGLEIINIEYADVEAAGMAAKMYISVDAPADEMHKWEGSDVQEAINWLNMLAMYEGSEDEDESFEAMLQELPEGTLANLNLMEYEGWYQIRDKDEINWLVPPDYQWNEAAKEKRIRL